MAAPKRNTTAPASPVAPSVPAELLVMVAKESVKYGGKRHLPGDPLLALPDDVDGLIANGLAAIADVPDEVVDPS